MVLHQAHVVQLVFEGMAVGQMVEVVCQKVGLIISTIHETEEGEAS